MSTANPVNLNILSSLLSSQKFCATLWTGLAPGLVLRESILEVLVGGHLGWLYARQVPDHFSANTSETWSVASPNSQTGKRGLIYQCFHVHIHYKLMLILSKKYLFTQTDIHKVRHRVLMADSKWANDEPQGQLPLAGFLQGLMQGRDGIDNGQNKAVSWEMRNNFWAKALSRSEFFKARKILNYWLILGGS